MLQRMLYRIQRLQVPLLGSAGRRRVPGPTRSRRIQSRTRRRRRRRRVSRIQGLEDPLLLVRAVWLEAGGPGGRAGQVPSGGGGQLGGDLGGKGWLQVS